PPPLWGTDREGGASAADNAALVNDAVGQSTWTNGSSMTKDYAELRASVLRDLDGLRYEVDPAKKVGWLLLDRPPLNVVSYRGRSQIAAIVEAFGQDPDVRVVVIRGANGIYSSGGDVKSFPLIERDGMSHLAWNIAAPE